MLCLFLAAGCRKDLLQPNAGILKSSLSVEEAKNYFNANIKKAVKPGLLMSTGGASNDVTLAALLAGKEPIWSKAYEKAISKGTAVKIPIDMGKTYAVVNKKTKAFVPLSSLNYLLMYKDSLQKVHTEWVYLLPDSAYLYGSRGRFTGTILVRTWDGKFLKKFDYPGVSQTPAHSYIKSNTLSSLTGKPQKIATGEIVVPFCVNVTYQVEKRCNCTAEMMIINGGCDYCPYYCLGLRNETICVWPTPECELCDDPPATGGGGQTPGGEPGQGGGGGGGSTNPNDYPPNCNPDPNYVMPSYPAPEGTEWILPCGDVPTPVEPDDTPDYGAGREPLNDNDQVYSPELGRTITFGEVRVAFETNERLTEIMELELEFSEHGDPWFPGKSSLDVLNEYRALRILYPNNNHTLLAAEAYWNVMGGRVHFALDLVGMAPVVGEAADILNGAIYFVEGDHLNAALSAGSALPVWGWTSTAGKWVKNASKGVTKPISAVAGKVAFKAIKSGKGYRFVKVAVGAFSHSAITALKAVKPADNTLTNLSRSLLDEAAHRIYPIAQSLKTKVDNILQHADIDGTKTEAICDEIFETGGFVKHDAKFGTNNGLDGVYIKKDASGNVEEIIINEAKQVNAVGGIKLNAANFNTGLPAQMSDAWISSRITQMVNNASTASLGNMLQTLFQNNRHLFTKTVTGVDKSTGEIIIVKLAQY